VKTVNKVKVPIHPLFMCN